ncbi:hypothetical protein ES708_32221 [subsurface metagenome]
MAGENLDYGDMAYGLVCGHLKIKIGFHSPVVRMCRHGVPYTACLEFGHAHLKLAGIHDTVHQQFVDLPGIGGFQ